MGAAGPAPAPAAGPAPSPEEMVRGEAPTGYRRVRETGDGNCFFHAVARQALEDSRQDGRCRREICDWMEWHLLPSSHAAGRSDLSEHHRLLIWQQREEVFGSGADDSAARRYVAKMRLNREWGTGIEALCAAYVYRRPVLVWSPDGFSELTPPAVVGERIYLLHNGRNHWDTAAPLAASPSQPSAPPPVDRRVLVDGRLVVEGTEGPRQIEQEEELGLETALRASLRENPAAKEVVDDHRGRAAAAAQARFNKDAARGMGRNVQQHATPKRSAAVAKAAVKEHPRPAASAQAAASPGTSGTEGRWQRRHRAASEPDVDGCLAALQRLGLSAEEATEVFANCDGDPERIKELYSIDWDEQGRTLQNVFET